MSYYVSPIIGSGTRDDPWRPAIADVATAWAAIIPSGPDGRPSAAAVLVRATVPAGASLPPGVIALPDVPLSTALSSLSPLRRAAVQSALTALGLSATAGMTVGDAVVALGTKLLGQPFDLSGLVA